MSKGWVHQGILSRTVKNLSYETPRRAEEKTLDPLGFSYGSRKSSLSPSSATPELRALLVSRGKTSNWSSNQMIRTDLSDRCPSSLSI